MDQFWFEFWIAILGFHSMMNQEQYHSSLLNKGQKMGLGFSGTAKAYQPKPMPFEPPNMTDIEKSIKQVRDDDYNLTKLNLNNIQVLTFLKFTNSFSTK